MSNMYPLISYELKSFYVGIKNIVKLFYNMSVIFPRLKGTIEHWKLFDQIPSLYIFSKIILLAQTCGEQ